MLVGVDARLRTELIEPRRCLLEQWVIAQPRFLLRIKGVPPALKVRPELPNPGTEGWIDSSSWRPDAGAQWPKTPSFFGSGRRTSRKTLPD
ncbi:hypothetical protein IA54_021400 [Xanthomonas phaseoli pv. syngonii LMG 9055]|uniref:Uncharacterized protein n=1 Tax=Xanthomonas phaseoli pv. syngonii LMG 9055 TaxID=1437878 RepID=A0A1V9HE15_9XANT|nr:hypothetical protein IA54_021400 [Xanthomonas phaseoli pv. syngonii LMG 9055]